MKIYYNGKCSTCRKALALLQANGHEPTIVKYLDTHPSLDELSALMKALGSEARNIVRVKEEQYRASGLSAVSDAAEIIAAIHRYPVLMQRPIVMLGDKAIIARPPERALELING